MNLSYHEIMNLINKEKDKYKEYLISDDPQVNKGYSRHTLSAIRDLEKEVRKHFAKKYR